MSPLWKNLPDGCKGFQNPVCDTLSCPWTYFSLYESGQFDAVHLFASMRDDPIPGIDILQFCRYRIQRICGCTIKADFALPPAASPVVSIPASRRSYASMGRKTISPSPFACNIYSVPVAPWTSLRFYHIRCAKVVDDLISILTPFRLTTPTYFLNFNYNSACAIRERNGIPLYKLACFVELWYIFPGAAGSEAVGPSFTGGIFLSPDLTKGLPKWSTSEVFQLCLVIHRHLRPVHTGKEVTAGTPEKCLAITSRVVFKG